VHQKTVELVRPGLKAPLAVEGIWLLHSGGA
jgi:hypothetical protein